MNLYKRKEFYEVMQVDNEWVILDLEDYTATTVNEVGNFCWNELATSHSSEEMVCKVKQHYDIDEDQIEKDITLFLANLHQCGLVENVG
ncbi:PqqD family protein [Halobacillus sp. B29]|uniref:PqqD family protein n=1 Tax=Halobacillus sp. B29 TaxID=3457432 RepID=UPI003FCE3839